MNKKYKILVLGGGGYFGLINATFLSYLGKDYDICKHIDSISGCSIGGIQACALMSGCDVQKLQKGFIQKGDQIFTKRWQNKINILDIPFYNNEALRQTLNEFVGETKIKDTRNLYPQTSIFIPTYNMSKGQMKVFDNITGKDDEYSLLDIGMYTSAAMFYFPILQDKGDCICDGGIREVVPVITHATGLKNKLGIDYKDMDVFVICAGNNIDQNCGNYEQVNEWGAIDWLSKFLINDITGSNRCTSKFWGQNLGFNSFEWFNPVQVYGDMDDVSLTDYMLEQCLMYKELFLQKWDKFING